MNTANLAALAVIGGVRQKHTAKSLVGGVGGLGGLREMVYSVSHILGRGVGGIAFGCRSILRKQARNASLRRSDGSRLQHPGGLRPFRSRPRLPLPLLLALAICNPTPVTPPGGIASRVSGFSAGCIWRGEYLHPPPHKTPQTRLEPRERAYLADDQDAPDRTQ